MANTRIDCRFIWKSEKHNNRVYKNIFEEEELEEKSNVQKMHIANSEKSVKIYNLNVIVAMEYRVSSKGAIHRIWVTKILKEYRKFNKTQKINSDFDKLLFESKKINKSE